MNYPHFAIGEVAIYWNPVSKRHLTEVTIAGPLKETLIKSANGAMAFVKAHRLTTMHKSGIPYCARIRYLRKKRLPSDDRQVTRWADCPWQPEKLRI